MRKFQPDYSCDHQKKKTVVFTKCMVMYRNKNRKGKTTNQPTPNLKTTTTVKVKKFKWLTFFAWKPNEY